MKFLLLLAAVAAASPPAHGRELRLYMIGNSLTDQVQYSEFQKLAESRGHTHIWGRSMTPGAPISWHWGNKPAFTQPPFGDFRKAFAEFQWDAVTVQPFGSYGQELEAAKNTASLLMEKNPQAQLYVYATWMTTSAGDFDRVFAQPLAPGATPKQSKEKIRAFYERFLPELTSAFPHMKKPRMIPGAHALALLNQKILAGQVPGLTSIWQLYNDGIHLGNHGSYLVACTFFATLYGESPIGLPTTGFERQIAAADRPFTPEMARIIQETVWETVTGTALTGVTAPETPVTVASPRLATAVQGEAYQFHLLPAFGAPPYHWSVTGGKLPGGAWTLDENGRLSGEGNAPGETKITFQVADARGRKAQRELMLTVEPDTAPTITSEKLPDAPAAQRVAVKIAGSGGNGTLLWTLPRGQNLPPGFTLGNDGTLAGTPVRPGSYRFAIEAQDADPAQPEVARKELTMEITPAPAGTVLIPAVEKGAITVDGVLEEPVWQLEQRVEKLITGAQSSAGARFGAVVSEGTLYLGVEVTEPEPKENPAQPAAGSSVEIYLDLLNNREAAYNFDDRRITITPGGKTAIIGSTRVIGAKAKRTATGYTVEVSLPNYNTGVKMKDDAIGLDIGVNDARGARLVWRGTAKNDTEPNGFATVLILDETAIRK